MMAQELEIRLFGGLRIALDGVPLTDFMSQKVPALLAYLALNPGPQRRDDLAALLWGELPDTDARNNLRQAIANLRRSLDIHLLITRETIGIQPDVGFFLDVAAFELGLGPQPPSAHEAHSRRLEDATALYRGDFLAGFFVRDAPMFEEWMLAQRARFRELALHALFTLTQLHLDTGRYDRAINDATRLLALDSWREEAHRQLMLALARTGQRSAALAQYKRCQRLLRDELDVEPSAETTALYEHIKASLARPRHNLPAAPELIGRAADLVAVLARLAAPACRMVTLVGPGGAGKTALALAAAHACADMYLDGVWLAPLISLTNPTELPAALADAVGFAFSGASPPATQLVDYLRRKELLLTLDNLEHLISSPALDLLCQILEQAPGVKLLITSRERLNLAAEWLYDLAGLPCPTNGGDPAAYPAVQLFVQRAQRVRPDFALTAETTPAVAHICQMIEGLPLAIELAAAGMRTLTPTEVATELAAGLSSLASVAHDIPERHRSLAAVFERSWARLDAEAQAALAQLAIFRGGFDRAAAGAVAGVGQPMLQMLADRSLLRISRAGRYDMHPLAQQFAAAQLVRPRDDAAYRRTRERHAQHFAALANQHEHEFHGDQDRRALAWMMQEVDNIRAAWEWGVQRADPALLEPFLESFLYFFDIQGRYVECVELTGQALRALKADGDGGQPTKVRVTTGASPSAPRENWGRSGGGHVRGLGRVLALHAAFEFRLGASDNAKAEAEAALALLEPLRPHRDIGHARLYLGAAWYGLGDLARAVEWFLAAVQAYEVAGHAWGIGAALDNAGYLEFLRGDRAAAAAHLTRGLTIARQTGSRYLLTGIYDHLATLTAAQGDFDAALDYVAQCQKVLEELDRPYIVASLSLSLSQIAQQAGDLGAAQAHLGRAVQIARDTGNRLDLTRCLLQAGAVAVARRDRAAGRAAYGEAAAMAQEIHATGLLEEARAGLAHIGAVMA